MKLDEIFDSTINLKWIQSGRFHLSEFELDSVKYSIQIEDKPMYDISKNLKDKKTAEVFFFIQGLNDIDAFSTLDNNSSANKIYGIVTNGIIDKVTDYDAISINVNLQHSSNQKEYKAKKRIYRFLMDRMKSSFGNFIYEKRNGNLGIQYIISKERLILSESLRCTPLEMIPKLIPTIYIKDKIWLVKKMQMGHYVTKT